MTDPIRTVAEGYDALGAGYADWQRAIDDDTAQAWLDAFDAILPAGRVVDLGCGAGVPATKFFVEQGREVIGVDISEAQLALARKVFPDVQFVRADMTEFDMEARSVAGVVALFSMFHLPRERLAATFRHIRGWLIPGGAFLATFTASDNPGGIEDWLGTRMYYSGFAPDATARLLGAAGFTLIRNEVVTMQEPEGDVAFHWLLART